MLWEAYEWKKNYIWSISFKTNASRYLMKSLMDLHSNLREKEEDATIIAEGYMAEEGVLWGGGRVKNWNTTLLLLSGSIYL